VFELFDKAGFVGEIARRRVREAWVKLPDREKVIIYDIFWLKKSGAQVSREIGKSEAWVSGFKQKGLRRLRKCVL